MPGLHNLVAQALATKAAGISGMAGASPTPIDSLNAPPWAVVGPPKGQLFQPGAEERMFLVYPIRVYVARLASSDRDQVAINDFTDLFILGWRDTSAGGLGITLGLAGTVMEALLLSWDTDKFATVGQEEYAVVDFVCRVEVARQATYTA